MRIVISVFHSDDGYYLQMMRNNGASIEYSRIPPVKRMELLPELIACIADAYRNDGAKVEIDKIIYELEEEKK